MHASVVPHSWELTKSLPRDAELHRWTYELKRMGHRSQSKVDGHSAGDIEHGRKADYAEPQGTPLDMGSCLTARSSMRRALMNNLRLRMRRCRPTPAPLLWACAFGAIAALAMIAGKTNVQPTNPWEAKDAFRNCVPAIDGRRAWPPRPEDACGTMRMCANEARLSTERDLRLMSLMRAANCEAP